MAWSKQSTTTNQWKISGTADNGANNAYDGAGGSVLEEFTTFLGTRGWTTVTTELADTPVAGDTSWEYVITKSVLCEDGTSVTMGYAFYYEEHPGASDQFKCYLWDVAGGVAGELLWSISSGTSAQPFPGRWSFWTSDQDSDSYLVLASEGASNFCLGFWPPAGSMFAPGFNSTTWPTAFGIAPLYHGAGPAYESQGGASGQAMTFNFLAASATFDEMNPVPFAMDFAYVSNNYGRPLFYSFGSDIQSYVQVNGMGRLIGPSNNSDHGVFALQLGTQYYLAVGDEQKLLLNTGTTPPAF